MALFGHAGVARQRQLTVETEKTPFPLSASGAQLLLFERRYSACRSEDSKRGPVRLSFRSETHCARGNKGYIQR